MIPNEEQTAIQEAARRFAQERLAPFAEGWDRRHEFPAEALREMGALGFLGMTIPKITAARRPDKSPTPWRWRRSPPDAALSRPS